MLGFDSVIPFYYYFFTILLCLMQGLSILKYPFGFRFLIKASSIDDVTLLGHVYKYEMSYNF